MSDIDQRNLKSGLNLLEINLISLIFWKPFLSYLPQFKIILNFHKMPASKDMTLNNVSSTNKTDHHDIAETLLKVCIKHHNPNPYTNLKD
jgi:hypothetical protein